MDPSSAAAAAAAPKAAPPGGDGDRASRERAILDALAAEKKSESSSPQPGPSSGKKGAVAWGARRRRLVPRIRNLKGHDDAVYSVAVHEGRIVSGSFDKTIKLWSVASRALQATLTGHTNCVSSVAFALDGMTLASGSNDNTIKLWTGALYVGTLP